MAHAASFLFLMLLEDLIGKVLRLTPRQAFSMCLLEHNWA